jgi:hypothetical protein
LENKNLAIVVEKGTDKKNVEVERRYRLVNKLKNGFQCILYARVYVVEQIFVML